MRVLVLTPYPLGRAPSQRFRWEQYVEPLRARGILLEPSSFLDDHGMDVVHVPGAWPAKAAATFTGALRRLRDTIVARRYDLVLVHRESLPVGVAWVEQILRAIRMPYAFDFDDAIYLAAVSEANRRASWLKGARKTVSVVENAGLVLAGNEHLRDWTLGYTPRVVVVPTTIDTNAYRPVCRRGAAPLCVGWSGSMSTIEHLKLLEPVLSQLQREREIRIRVIGDPSYTIEGAVIEALPWREASEIDDLAAIDIGVMPLPDDEWARGKCGLKALQYMALGIPTVLSPVGVNRKIARDGAAILAATSPEWATTLRALIDDEELRARVGGAGRVRVEREYSVEATLPLWEHALRDAAASAKR
jgi:glycosyltransferase involved in cell wall biosynthesis